MPTRLSLFACLWLAMLPAEDAWKGVDRIVAVGDVHGGYTSFVQVLQQAGVIDTAQRWTGGRTHLVQMGDILDRGPDSRKVMELLMALEKPAVLAGGRVHCLIGNHEAMNLYGDLRYVHAGEFSAFAREEAPGALDALWERETRKLQPRPDALFQAKWQMEHPPGWVEHRRQFGPQGRYGKWIRSLNAIIRINDTLFLHGGLSPKYGAMSLAEINEGIRGELRDGAQVQPGGFVLDEEGPLFYRGIAQENAAMQEHVAGLLRRFGVRRIVLGHTATPGRVVRLYNGAVLVIDAGLGPYYGDHRIGLVIEGGRTLVLSPGRQTPLPF